MAIDKKIEEQNDSFFNELIPLIKGNTVIPVIGYELLNTSAKGNVNENPELEISLAEDPNKDLLTKLMESYDKELCAEVISGNKAINIEIKSGYDLLNAVYQELTSLKRKTFLSTIHSKIDSIRNYVETIPAPFELLAKIKCFQFYINATIFNNMEYAVNSYKAKKMKINNPDDDYDENSSYDVLNCNLNSLTDIKINSYRKEDHLANRTKFSTSFFNKPCILNLFGIHNSKGDYIILDSDMIELVNNLFKSKQKYDDLKFILKDADFLFIGCDFSDWFLRLFIRFCVDKQLDRDKLSTNYIFEKGKENQEFSRTFFITSYGMHKVEMNPSEFVKELYRRLDEDDDRKEFIEEDKFNNSVFISYNHEDKAIADKIVEQLKSKYIDVWYDRRGDINYGDEINSTIKNGIDNSCAFLPIISGKVNDNVDQPKYYKKEWNYAVQNKKEGEIFPIRISDFTNNTLYSAGAFSQDTINKLLLDGGFKFEKIDIKDLKLEEDFLIFLKNFQNKNRLQQ